MSNYISTSVDATKELGYQFASKLKKGDTIVLNGDLGSGKTIFVSGFLKFYGKEQEASSPTFTIVNEHNLTKDLNLYHFDVYRLESSDEFLAIGGDEYFSQGITFKRNQRKESSNRWKEGWGNNRSYSSTSWNYLLMPSFAAYTSVCSRRIESIYPLISLIRI